MSGSIIKALLWLFVFTSVCLPGVAAHALDPLLPGKLQQFFAQESSRLPAGVRLGAAVVRIEDGKEVYSFNGAELLTPASVLKLFSTVAALKYLGGEYRFPTEIFVDSLPVENDPRLDATLGMSGKDQNKIWSAGNLYLRGYGDPSFSETDLYSIAQTVRDFGVLEINDIIIDDSLFMNPPPASGPRPYQAALSATSLNNNCYRVSISPAGSGQPAFVRISPPFPHKLVSRVKSLSGKGENVEIAQRPPSETFNPQAVVPRVGPFFPFEDQEVTINVQGRIGLQAPRQAYYLTVRNPPHYMGSVLRHFLELADVKVQGKIFRGETTGTAKLLHLHQSKALADILRDLNHYSSNFVAGQLLYALGQDQVGFFRREIGLERVASVLQGLGHERGQFLIADASGLDPASKVTANQLAQLLQQAYRDFGIAPDFVSSLSRYGKSGTLERRFLLPEAVRSNAAGTLAAKARQRAESVWAKTGTLANVSSLAGYLETRTGDRLAFAIMINGEMTKDAATSLEDNLVKLLVEVE